MRHVILTLMMSFMMLPVWAQHHENNRHNDRHDVHIHHDADRHHHVEPAPMIRIATPEEVALISSYIDDIMSSSDRSKALKLCAQLVPLAAEDVATLVAKISFDDDKLDVLQFCYPFCPNKGNYIVAIEQLTFSSNKEKMYKFVATYR